MKKLLQGKKIIITGATSGIGKSIAVKAAEEGADIAFCGLTKHGSSGTINHIEKCGRRAFFKEVDLTNIDDAKIFAVEALEFLNGVDGLVNNAASNCWLGLNNTTYTDIEKCMSVNLYSPLIISQTCFASMKSKGAGSIINIASIHGISTLPGTFPYNVTKAALIELTKSQALEWSKYNIHSYSISPALIETEAVEAYLNNFESPEAEKKRLINHYPLRKAGKPEDVASIVLFLLSNQSGFMTGNNILIDGGITCLLESPDK